MKIRVFFYIYNPSTREIISGIKKLPYRERLKIIEVAIKTLEETDEARMEKAAKALSKEYETNKALTAFTDIDLDHFYETR